MKKENKYAFGIIAVILLIAAAILIITLGFGSNQSKITNFQECADAGNPVMESYPRQCRADGITYTEEINEQKKYVSRDADECSRIKFMCEAGRSPFFDESGCGCELDSNIENLPELFRQKSIDKMGVIPVEGFDPDLYMGVFPGLTNSDFDNTKAIGGIWKVSGSNLTFIRDESEGITSADGTLDDEGVLTLIGNLERRLGKQVDTEEDLDSLIVLISQEPGKLKANYCSEESRNADACIAIYDPVCGWSDPAKIQCIRYPCAQTYGNSCEACRNPDVLYWTAGECPD